MTKKQRRSSRQRNQSRRRQRQPQSPVVAIQETDVLGQIIKKEIPNRAKRRMDRAWRVGATGRSRRLEAQQKRQQRLQKARLVLKGIRHATIRLMRRKAG